MKLFAADIFGDVLGQIKFTIASSQLQSTTNNNNPQPQKILFSGDSEISNSPFAGLFNQEMFDTLDLLQDVIDQVNTAEASEDSNINAYSSITSTTAVTSTGYPKITDTTSITSSASTTTITSESTAPVSVSEANSEATASQVSSTDDPETQLCLCLLHLMTTQAQQVVFLLQ